MDRPVKEMFNDVRTLCGDLKSRLLEVVPINESITRTMETSMAKTGIAIKIPANCYVCVTATAIWGNSSPHSVQVLVEPYTGYCFAEGDKANNNASATLSFYAQQACTIYVSARYSSAASNPVVARGFYIKLGGALRNNIIQLLERRHLLCVAY